MPQQNWSVESTISRAFKAGPAARLGVNQLFPEETRGCTDPNGTRLSLESLLWGPVNDEWLSTHEVFYGSRPPLLLLPFFYPAFHRIPRTRKTEPRARMRYFLNFGYNCGRDCYTLL